MKHPNDTNTGRRRFIAGLTAVSGLAASGTALARPNQGDTGEPQTAAPDDESGYHETDHVRAYYRSLRD